MYCVTIDRRIENFDNLSQVYGFLCGVSLIREVRPNFKTFKRFWLLRRRRKIESEPFKIKSVSCQISVKTAKSKTLQNS